MLKVWNMVLVTATFALSLLRHVPHPQRRRRLDPRVRPVDGRRLPAGVHRRRAGVRDRADRVAAAAAAQRAPAGVGGVARGDVPVQQPAAAGVRVRHPVGRDVPGAVRGRARRSQSTVSTPYYNFFLVAFGLPLLVADRDRPADRLAAGVAGQPGADLPLAGDVRRCAAGGLLALLGLGSSSAGLTAFSLCVFVTITIGLEFARGTSARRAIAGGSWPRALVDLIGRNRRRYGGYIVHLAIVLLVVGIDRVRRLLDQLSQATLAPGQSMQRGRLHARPTSGCRRSRGRNSATTLGARSRSAATAGRVGTLSPGRADLPDRGPRHQRGRHPHAAATGDRPLHDPPGRSSQQDGRTVDDQGAGEPDGGPDLAGRPGVPARRR